MSRVNQYLPHYAPGAGNPTFEDGEMFAVTVPIEAPVEAPVALFASERTILSALAARELGRAELLARLGHTQRSGSFRKAIDKLLRLAWVERTIPDKPNSRLQMYRLTQAGSEVLRKRGEVDE